MILANCQSSVIRTFIQRYFSEIQILETPYIHEVNINNNKQKILSNLTITDIIIYQPLSNSYGDLSSQKLKITYPNKTFVSFPSIYFSGFFPQLTYLRSPQGKILKGPLSDYHDTRIINAFFKNESKKQCIERLLHEDSSLFQHYDIALTESLSRDKNVDIPVMDIILDEMQIMKPLYTFNHPTNRVIWRIVEAIMKHLGFATPNVIDKLHKTDYLSNTRASIPNIIPKTLGLPWRSLEYSLWDEIQPLDKLVDDFYLLYKNTKDFSAICRHNNTRFHLEVNILKMPSSIKPNRENTTMYVSLLLSDLNINCFSEILAPYSKINSNLKVCVDGGAGLGQTAEKIFKGLPEDDIRVIAYEPNPKNIASFKYKDPRLTVVEAALGDVEGEAEFLVAQTTQRESENNPYLVKGTSFVGKLTTSTVNENEQHNAKEKYPVRVTRLEQNLASLGFDQLDFIKLDLQGGELAALKGLGEMINKVHWMWIEYGGQAKLLDFLETHDFILFDTEYLFFGKITENIERDFRITRQGTNSIGTTIFFGRRKHIWKDYKKEFNYCKKHYGLIQTDLVVVSKSKLSFFVDALRPKINKYH